MHRLTPLAQAEIDKLRADGITPTPHEVLHINYLAGRVETPAARLSLARGRPVTVGGATLWPLTLAAADWFDVVGQRLAGRRMQVYALAYAMAHGDSKLPSGFVVAALKVYGWARRLRCRMAELVEAVSQVQQQDSVLDTGETGPKTSPGDISMMLTAMTGIRPEVWEYQCSIAYVLALLDAIVAQNAADGHSTKHDPRIKAERALGLAIMRIKKRHEKEKAAADVE